MSWYHRHVYNFIELLLSFLFKYDYECIECDANSILLTVWITVFYYAHGVLIMLTRWFSPDITRYQIPRSTATKSMRLWNHPSWWASVWPHFSFQTGHCIRWYWTDFRSVLRNVKYSNQNYIRMPIWYFWWFIKCACHENAEPTHQLMQYFSKDGRFSIFNMSDCCGWISSIRNTYYRRDRIDCHTIGIALCCADLSCFVAVLWIFQFMLLMDLQF